MNNISNVVSLGGGCPVSNVVASSFLFCDADSSCSLCSSISLKENIYQWEDKPVLDVLNYNSKENNYGWNWNESLDIVRVEYVYVHFVEPLNLTVNLLQGEQLVQGTSDRSEWNYIIKNCFTIEWNLNCLISFGQIWKWSFFTGSN